MAKQMLEVVMGIPLPGHYDDLKGIDLWGDGEVYGRDDSTRNVEQTHTGDNLSQKIARITAGFTIFKEAPIFVDRSGTVMDYESFVEANGEILDPEGYEIVTSMYEHCGGYTPDGYMYLYESSDATNPFSTKWHPVILEHVQKPHFKARIHRITSDFINKNSEELSIRYPSTNITIPKNVIDDILKLVGIGSDTPKAVSELIDSLNVKTDFKSISQSPHQIVLTAILMAATEIKSDAIINDVITLVAFTMYPLIFRKYFPVVDPNKTAMEEAVLTASLKFYIAKTDNLLAWVRILTEVPYDFYKERFAAGNKSDVLYINFLNRLRNTMNQQFKSLYSIYKKAYNNKSLSKLNNDEFVTLSSNTDKIQIYTMSVYDKINDVGFRTNICSSASKIAKLSNETLESYLKEINKHLKKYNVNELILQTLTIYFNLGNKDDFLLFMTKAYPKIIRGKDNIYKPMNKYLKELTEQLTEFDPDFSDRYNYGIYVYFVILINIYINNITNKLSELSGSSLKQSGSDSNNK